MEVVVALSILTLVLGAIGTNLDAQLSSMSASKNRQAAEGLLTRAIAEVQALPYKEVAQGLADTDRSTTTGFIHKSGTTWTFKDSAEALHGTGEVIPHFQPATGATPPPPFYPHVSEPTLNGVDFKVSVFPTLYETPPAGTPTHTAKAVPGVLRVTVIVSQVTPTRGSNVSLVGQTLIYSAGTNCLSGSSNPFAAPCRPNFAASALAADGQVRIQAEPGAPYAIQGATFTYLNVILAGASSTSEFVQTSSVQGTAEATGATVVAGAGQSKIQRVATAASTDPASPDGTYQHQTVTAATGSVSETGVNPAGSVNTLTATPSAKDTGRSMSAAEASLSTSCDNLTGKAQTTAFPCGSDTATQGAPVTLSAGLYAGSTALGTVALASVGTQTASYPDRAFTDRHAPGTATCSATGTAVCTTAGAQTSLGTMTLAKFPPTVAGPPGWNNTLGLVTLSRYSARTTSASRTTKSGRSKATGAHVPIPGAAAPTLTYWNGSGYASLTLDGTSTRVAVPLASVTDDSFTGGALTVSMSATVTVGAATTSSNTPAGCVTACSALASVAPVVVQIAYTVQQGDTLIAGLQMDVSVGSVTTRTSYQAPS